MFHKTLLWEPPSPEVGAGLGWPLCGSIGLGSRTAGRLPALWFVSSAHTLGDQSTCFSSRGLINTHGPSRRGLHGNRSGQAPVPPGGRGCPLSLLASVGKRRVILMLAAANLIRK